MRNTNKNLARLKVSDGRVKSPKGTPLMKRAPKIHTSARGHQPKAVPTQPKEAARAQGVPITIPVQHRTPTRSAVSNGALGHHNAISCITPSDHPLKKGTKVSVVIPTYNRPEILYRTIYSLVRQEDQDYEILVSVDDDFDIEHKSVEVLEGFIADGHPIKYFMTNKYKKGEGWSLETYPYNVGIRHASGDIILLNSGDVMSVTDTIAQHRELQLSNNGVAVVSTVHAVTQELQKNIDTYDWKNNPKSILFKGSTYKMFSGLGVSYTEAYPFEDAGGVCYNWLVSFRAASLRMIRGFDENFYGRIMCADDDLVYRVKQAGITYKPCPSILGVHQFHASTENISKKDSVQSPKLSGHTMAAMNIDNPSPIRNDPDTWGTYPRIMT